MHRQSVICKSHSLPVFKLAVNYPFRAMDAFQQVTVPLKCSDPATQSKSGSLSLYSSSLNESLSSDAAVCSNSLQEVVDQTFVSQHLPAVGNSYSINTTVNELRNSSPSDAARKTMLGRRTWQDALSSAQPFRQMLVSINQDRNIQQRLLPVPFPPVTGTNPSSTDKGHQQPVLRSKMEERSVEFPLASESLPPRFGLISDVGLQHPNLLDTFLQPLNPFPCSTSPKALEVSYLQQFADGHGPESSLLMKVFGSPMSCIQTETTVAPVIERVQQPCITFEQRTDEFQLQNWSHRKDKEESSAEDNVFTGDAAQPYASISAEWPPRKICFEHRIVENTKHEGHASRKRQFGNEDMESLSYNRKRAHHLHESDQITQIPSISYANPLKTSRTVPRGCKPTACASRPPVSPALNTNLKPRAKHGSVDDPQIIAARQRRERINARLKILQELVPNGSKVDLITMLEKAINYVKFLQLQVKVLSNDEYWSSQKSESCVLPHSDQRSNIAASDRNEYNTDRADE